MGIITEVVVAVGSAGVWLSQLANNNKEVIAKNKAAIFTSASIIAHFIF